MFFFAGFRLYTDQLSVARRLDYEYGDSVQLKVDFLTEYGQCAANMTKCTPALSNKDTRVLDKEAERDRALLSLFWYRVRPCLIFTRVWTTFVSFVSATQTSSKV